MDPESRKAMNAHYSELLARHGPTPEALAYRCEQQMTKRYALLAEVEPLPARASVLDVGCGLGHFCDYLRAYGWRGTYTGLDINADMVAAARERLDGETFLCLDLLDQDPPARYDYVFCGATVEHRPAHGDPVAYLRAMVERMFAFADRALAFDVFSARAEYENPDNLYVAPERLLEIGYALTKRLVLRNDARPYELMMYLYRPQDTDAYNIFSAWTPRGPQIVDEPPSTPPPSSAEESAGDAGSER